MDDVRGDFLGPPHGTTPAAVIANKEANLYVLLLKNLSFDFYSSNSFSGTAWPVKRMSVDYAKKKKKKAQATFACLYIYTLQKYTDIFQL